MASLFVGELANDHARGSSVAQPAAASCSYAAGP